MASDAQPASDPQHEAGAGQRRSCATSAAGAALTGAFVGTGSALIVAWLAGGAVSAADASCFEALHAAALLLALAAGVLVCRGPSRMAESATARLWTVGVFVASAAALSPAFQRSASTHGLWEGQAWWARAAAVLPFALAPALWLAWRASPNRHSSVANPRSPAEKLEAFLCTPGARGHIAVVGMLLATVDVGLSGLPLRAALPRAALLAAMVLCLPALFRLAATLSGQRTLNAALAAALGISAAVGTGRYAELRAKADAIPALLEQDREAEAKRNYEEALALNGILRARGTAVDLEAHWAAYRERTRDYEGALVHWRRIAEQQGVDPTEMLPIRRILCKMGDSLNAWRRLIYQGFSAITGPELAPGIRALGDNPASDLRARLLAALLAWEQREPPEELRLRLEAVRQALPNEPNACNLLKRLGADVPDTNLWLPADLIVGRRITTQSVLGAIDELGEVETLVVLNEGRWEVGVNARGTPLHEEWPIIRVEFNGKEIGRTQVNRAENHEAPFTVDVNRGNIYRVKIVFQNRMEDWVEGRAARRGLVINGLSFRRGRD